MNKRKESPDAVDKETGLTVAAIDFGSKTFKFIIGEQTDKKIRVQMLKKETLLLGQELLENRGTISAQKLQQIDNILGRFASECRTRGIGKILGIGTSAIRSAKNKNAVVALIESHGIEFEIARGKREGSIGYLAATHGQPNQLVSDMGSRSFQISFHCNNRLQSFSLKAGYIIAYDRFYKNCATFTEADKKFRKLLEKAIGALPAGTTKFHALASNSMACYVAAEKKQQVTDKPVSRRLISGKINELKMLETKQYSKLKKQLKKADKILPGLTFVDYLLELSGHHEVHIVSAELPEGLIVEYFLNRH